jgi:hypothetical protein
VPEVNAAFEKLAGGDDGHGRIPSLPGRRTPGVRLLGAEPFDAA